MTILEPGEIIIGVHVPAPTPGSRGTYLKAMERKVWAFALVSVALQLVLKGDVVQDARVVLGGVAPKPWRVSQTEVALCGQHITAAVISQVAELAVAGAKPLAHNHYKIALVKGIVAEALSAI
jgi:xanthine dehydrogenase YagS FAD-binding subunit